VVEEYKNYGKLKLEESETLKQKIENSVINRNGKVQGCKNVGKQTFEQSENGDRVMYKFE
jgi:hypothetical protein